MKRLAPALVLSLLALSSCGSNPAPPTDPGLLPDPAAEADPGSDSPALDTPEDLAPAPDVPDARDTDPIPDLPADEGPSDSPTQDQDAGPPPCGPAWDPAGIGFFSRPAPSDALRTAEGKLDLSGFPNPQDVPIVDQYVAFAETVLDGWSVAQPAWFPFTCPVDTASFPADSFAAAQAQPVQLVDVTAGSPRFGTRIPLLWQYRDPEGAYVPAFTLAIRPVWGFVLEEGHAYVAFVTTDVRAAGGGPFVRPEAFETALAASPGDPDPIVRSLDPLRLLIQSEPDLAARVLAATVFTVGHPTAELRAIRDYLWKDAPAPVVTDLERGKDGKGFARYEGHYQAPNFLSGTPPYEEKGGFEFGPPGVPVVQFQESMRFALTVPLEGDMPETGWPIVLMSHGTGGSATSFIASSKKVKPAVQLSGAGLAAVGIDQPLHGARVDPPLSDTQIDFYSFNFLNPEAGRSVQRQSVADELSLVRLLESGGLKVPADKSASGREERFDAGRVLFFGHSQGGTTGGMLFGLIDRIRGGLLSGAGAGLSLTTMLRKDPVDFKILITEAVWEWNEADKTDFHPFVALLQAIMDPTDPLAYASGYLAFDPATPGASPRSLLLTEGLQDPYTPPATAETLAATAGIPVLAPFVHKPLGMVLKGIADATLPFEGNLASGAATGLLIQFAENGHYAIYDNEQAGAWYTQFLKTLADGPGRVGE